jgi:hypothetical protein
MAEASLRLQVVVPRRRRPIAVALILLLLFGTNAGLHAGGDDDCDAPQGAVATAGYTGSSAQLRLVSIRGDEPGHCAICHWLQTFRAGSAAEGRFHVSLVPRRPIHTHAIRPVATADRFSLPLRAPPA